MCLDETVEYSAGGHFAESKLGMGYSHQNFLKVRWLGWQAADINFDK
jgi:hypothetical protein